MVKRFPLILLLFMTLSYAQDVGTMPKTEPPIFLLKGATIVVGTGQVLSGASVLVNDGLIQAVGENVAVPEGAWELDVQGMYIYPGLIDTLTSNGLKKAPTAAQGSAPQRARPGRSAPAAQSDEGPGYFAHVSAADQLADDDKKLASWREAGVLTLNVAPDQGIFRGTTAVVNLNGEEDDRMIVRQKVAMPMSFRGLGYRNYPGSLMGVIAHIRQTLLDANHYHDAWNAYEVADRGLKRPETDRTLESLQPVIDGTVPLVFPAKEDREIRRALALCEESGTKCVIAGGFDIAAVADELKARGVPVLVSLNYPQKSKDGHPEADESLETLRRRADAPKAAGLLQKAGVQFAFYSDGASAGDFLKNLRRAVENGLSEESALRAATLSAAEILGVDDRLGTVEIGKIANLVVSDNPILSDGAQIRHVFVDGYHFEVPVKPAAKNGDSAQESQIGGTWEVTITTPEQDRSVTFNLTQDGSSVSGSVTTEMGTLDVYDGSMSGAGFSFKVELTMGMGPIEITFSGTVSGDTLAGTASVGDMGEAPMEGKRVP
jgi:imidazolonepropionase-like amidohydrolase